MQQINPIIKTDYPDPDVIRVEDTYYMISTTMHFFPGGVILQSFDLIHWEIVSYVFDKLDNTPAQCLEGEQSIYGKGMWAASLRYHNKKFYVLFSAYDTEKTYLYLAEQIRGPWRKQYVEGVYHHNSILFDDDGRIYIVWGMNEIHLAELNADLSGLKEDGVERIIVRETRDTYVGYEGSHFYKINGKYYLFLIHWTKDGTSRRTQACFRADHIDGEFIGGDIFNDDFGFQNQGIAQGGIVDTPDGSWYAILFQDHGAVGRIPVLLPVTWVDHIPVFGQNGKLPEFISVKSNRPDYEYEPLYSSDIFTGRKDKNGKPELKKVWQWNHEPDDTLWSQTKDGGLCIRTGKISVNLSQAVNTLTQRMMYPISFAEVTLDVSGMNNGDYAGLCALQGYYGWIGVTKVTGRYYLAMWSRKLQDTSLRDIAPDYMPGNECCKIPFDGGKIELKIKVDFTDKKDIAEFYYKKNGKWIQVGKHSLFFKLDHFAGCRFGMFAYSTSELGGKAVFYNFQYHYPNNSELG